MSPNNNNDRQLKVAAISLDIVRCSPDENMSALGRAMAVLENDVDLVVLPELFTTGYTAEPEVLDALAQSNSGSTMRTIAMLAERYNVAIAGSFLGRTGQKIYNRAFFVEPSGDETFYDKHHLFSLSSESKLFTPGKGMMPVIRFRGWNITMMVCYDLRFPVWSRNRGNAYDLLLVPANWPDKRLYAWEHLLIARAIENQACVVGANRSGVDDYGTYTDSSFIFDAWGTNVGKKLSRRSAPAPIVVGVLSLAEVQEARYRMPAAADADPFNLVD